MTDDNLRVEYAAPLWLHTDVALRNWDDLVAVARVPWNALDDEPMDWLDLAAAYEAQEDTRRAKNVRARVLGWTMPGTALHEELLEKVRDPEEEGPQAPKEDGG